MSFEPRHDTDHQVADQLTVDSVADVPDTPSGSRMAPVRAEYLVVAIVAAVGAVIATGLSVSTEPFRWFAWAIGAPLMFVLGIRSALPAYYLVAVPGPWRSDFVITSPLRSQARSLLWTVAFSWIVLPGLLIAERPDAPGPIFIGLFLGQLLRAVLAIRLIDRRERQLGQTLYRRMRSVRSELTADPVVWAKPN